MDENGEPLVVYRGTRPDSTVHTTGMFRSKIIFATPNEIGASRYGEPIELFVNAKNPAIIDYKGEEYDKKIEDEFYSPGLSFTAIDRKPESRLQGSIGKSGGDITEGLSQLTNQDETTKNVARARYEIEVEKLSTLFTESNRDRMVSLNILQKAIEEERGEKIEDWENAYWAENALSSKSKAEQELWENKYGKNLRKEIAEIEKQGVTTKELIPDFFC